ncbi:hypothetical protein ABI_08070 [Asticcacaulis biprosthecium C19]|uniref:Uncharacterized protein n=1 Tax=Asticcacaulis biprosthecium C19 TaxID=715226 RepID=F4QLV2_9CAUL|nr:hypothetical protein ABI_08070 [Asticcacaulis biprosthecium C19]
MLKNSLRDAASEPIGFASDFGSRVRTINCALVDGGWLAR